MRLKLIAQSMGRKSRLGLSKKGDRIWDESVCRSRKSKVRMDRSNDWQFIPKDSRKGIESSGYSSFAMANELVANSQQGTSGSSLGLSLRNWSLTGLGQKYADERFPRNHFLISLMSYNVLSDQLCRRHPELYKGKPDDVLDWETRFSRIISEISFLKSQIVCLQEVETEHFSSHFVPALARLGYKGIYKKRTNDKKDGCAIFYYENELYLELWDEVEYNQPFVSSLDRDNVGLIAKFRPLGARPAHKQSFCVATTHLLYNPKRHDVKLAQLAVLLAELDRISFCGYTRHESTPKPKFYPCIVTGDFNLNPLSPIYKFMVEGKCLFKGKSKRLCDSVGGERLGKILLPPQLGITDQCKHLELTHNRNIQVSQKRPTRLFNSESGNGAYFGNEVHSSYSDCFGSGSLFHSFRFRSAYKPTNGARGATAYQEGYIVVDYIFYSGVRNRFNNSRSAEGNLKLLSRLDLLPGSKISEIGGFPCQSLPSDHLCLAAKFLLSPQWD